MADAQLNVNQVRISAGDLRADMILARDVITTSGILLLSKDTVLNKHSFGRLISNNIQHVYIKEYSINYDQPQFSNEDESKTSTKPSTANTPHAARLHNKRIPIRTKPDFRNFQHEYTKRVGELKSHILAIGNGEKVDTAQLYGTTEAVMKQLKFKSDVFSYLNFLKDKDEQTFAHSSNVALLANLFGIWLGYDKEKLMNLTTAGLLHDIGKTQVPDEILNKEGKLSDSEYDIIKKHTTFGFRLLGKQDFHPEIKYAALMHHERIDGSGYPLAAKGPQIKTFAKIIAICDIYDAMTSNRSYRSRICPFESIKQFEQASYGIIDTEMLLIFLQNVAYTYLGSWVRLSDNREGEIVFINKNNLSCPMVRIGSDIIDLNTDKGQYVIEVI